MTTWITITGWTLLHFVWQGAAIAAMAACGFAFVGKAYPRRRYILATGALAVMLLAPMVTATWIAASERPRLVEATTANTAQPIQPATARPFTFDTLPTTTNSSATSRVTRVFPVIVALWLTGVALLLVRLASGWWRVRRLHRTALGAPPSRWQVAANRLAARLRIRRPIHVRDSVATNSPMVIGWWRPVVLLPVTAFAGLTPTQAEAVIAHELAHVLRHDYAVNLLQHVVETVLFYHPAVWWLSHRMRIERELCCDAIAVACGHDAWDYASALTSLEEARTTDATLAVAAASGALLDRVRRILNPPPEPHRSVANAVVTTLIVALLVAGVGGGYQWSTRTVQAQARGVVAIINGEAVTDADLDHFRPLHGLPAETPLPRILVALVDERLIVQRGRQIGSTVDSFEMKRTLAGAKEQNGLHSDAELQAVLAKQHLTLDDLIQHLQRSRMVFHVGFAEGGRDLVIPDDEAKQYFDSHVDEFPLQTFDLARPALLERLRLMKMGRGVLPEPYLQSLRAAASIEWRRPDLQRAYTDGLAQRTSSLPR